MTTGVIAVITKQSAEKHSRKHDFTRDLPQSSSIASFTVTVKEVIAGTDTTATMVEAVTSSGVYGYYRLKGGVSGSDYLVSLKMTRNDGDIYEYEITMKVRDI
jgi:hypothetical protein